MIKVKSTHKQHWTKVCAITILSFLLCVVCTTELFAAGKKKSNGAVRYEGEDAVIVNSTHKKSDAPLGCERQSFFSKQLAVGGINSETELQDIKDDWSNIAYVTFTVDAPTEGKYDVVLGYNGDDDKTILVRVNNEKFKTVSVPSVSKGAWDRMHKITIPVTFKSGENKLKISGTIGNKGWLNIDYIDVSPAK